MKKLAFFSILLTVFVTGSVFSKPCELQTCNRSTLKNSQATMDASDGSEQCYYCGALTGSCNDGDIIGRLDSIGNVINLYKCNITVFNNTWDSYNPGIFCDNSELKSDRLNDISLNNAKKYYSLNGGKKTTGYKSGEETVLRAGSTSCVYVKCNDGFESSSDKTKCVEKGKASCEANTAMKWENGTCVCKKHPVEQVVNGKCVNVELEKQKQKEKDDKNAAWLAARKAECKAASATSAFWSPTLNKCDCSDKSKLWSDSQKQCVEKSADCDVATISWLHEMQLKYNDADITKAIVNILDFCTKNSSNRSQNELENNITNLKVLIQNYENAKIQKSKEITDSANNIKLLYGNISGLKNEASVWKDKEGDFNKSRLISDSVAGVVLGTAGGLITSSVIKKNQTENGFEDISCTVGGQVVAGWNDEFTVGIR